MFPNKEHKTNGYTLFILLNVFLILQSYEHICTSAKGKSLNCHFCSGYYYFFRINCFNALSCQCPFGGFKMSGNGREL